MRFIDVSLSTLLDLSLAFDSDYFLQLIDENIPIFKSPKQSLQFIQSKDSFLFENKCQEAINQVSKFFSKIEYSEIEKCSTPILNKLFDSKTLFVGNEDDFFKIIQQLIQKDSENKILLSKIKFPFVSSSEMKNFFENFPFHDINLSLFESLKDRLFCDVLLPPFENKETRWTKSSLFLDSIKIQLIIQILDEFFQSSENRVSNLQNLLQEYSKSKQILEEFFKSSENIISKHENLLLLYKKNKFTLSFSNFNSF
jgi:hypothetical protein